MHLLNTKDISKDFINELFTNSTYIIEQIKKPITRNFYNNKIITLACFEQNTKTSLSFESAMYRLGGNVIKYNYDISNLKKSACFEDTIHTLSSQCDVLIMSNTNISMLSKASKITNIHIINEGNGDNPIQALSDIYTMYKKYGWDFMKKSILITGNIKNNKTIHGLINILNLYPDIKIYFLPFQNMNPSQELINLISKIHNQKSNEIILNINNFNVKHFDILYVSKFEKERIENDYEMIQTKNINTDFIIDNNFVNKINDDSIIIHPFPRSDELSKEVNNNKRNYYFEQIKHSIEIKTLLLYKILQE